MAMMDGNDPNVSSGDWWSENAPQSGGYTQVATAPDGVPVYQNSSGQYFTQNADGSYTQQFQGGAPAWLTQGQGSQTSGGGGDPLRAQIAQWASMPGADPSLANDPDYWVNAINSRGGLNDSNRQYWQDASVGPTAFFNNPTREQGGGNQYASGVAAPSSGFGAPPAPYASNPNAPTYTAPTVPSYLSSPYESRSYTAPTGADVANEPGYAFGLEQGTKQIQRSAAAQGTVLNPGTVQALNRYGTDYATTKYDNAVTRGLSIFNTNEADRFGARQQNQSEFQQNVVNPAQQTFQNQYASYLNDNARTLNDYLTNYGIQHTADTDYWNRLKDVSGSGLTAALGDRAA